MIRRESFVSSYLMTKLQAIDTFYLSWKICETCKCKYMLMTWALPFVEDPPKEFLMVEFFELANQEQPLNTFMNTNNYNSNFLINTKNRYLEHICFDVCNVYKKLHWWRSLQSITFVLCAPEKKLGTKCLFIKISKGSNSSARYLIRFMS